MNCKEDDDMQATLEQELCLHETTHIEDDVQDFLNATGHYQVETPIEVCDDCDVMVGELGV